LGYGLLSQRLTNPAVEIEDLPPLDLVVLSHLHGDHFDRVAEEKLDKTLPIITTPHAARYLEGKGFRPLEGLRTWESMSVRKGDARLRITAMPGTHAPGPLRKVLPPVMGSMLEFGDADEGGTRLRLYISGDTLVHNRLREIPQRYPEIDLALLHLGGTRVLGILVTMDAEQGVEALRIIDPRTAVPIHYNDYGVFKSPLEDFQRAVTEADLEDRVRYLAHGETYEFEVP
jgi:L-ascorbate metabolism protein UlaG (beta-lactamase superfamily)